MLDRRGSGNYDNDHYYNHVFIVFLTHSTCKQYVIVLLKVNILILVRVIKEMTAMEQTKDNHVEQIRYQHYFSLFCEKISHIEDGVKFKKVFTSA